MVCKFQHLWWVFSVSIAPVPWQASRVFTTKQLIYGIRTRSGISIFLFEPLVTDTPWFHPVAVPSPANIQEKLMIYFNPIYFIFSKCVSWPLIRPTTGPEACIYSLHQKLPCSYYVDWWSAAVMQTLEYAKTSLPQHPQSDWISRFLQTQLLFWPRL